MSSVVSKKRTILWLDFVKERTSYDKTLQLFFCYPDTEYTLTEVARAVDVTKSAAWKAVQKLVNEEIVLAPRSSYVHRIKANTESSHYLERKRIFNLESIYRSGLVEDLIKKNRYPQAIILFGSFERAQDTESSDIDIAVYSKEKPSNAESEILVLVEKYTNRKVSLHHINKETPDGVFSNMINGTLLYGSVPARLWKKE